MKYHYQKGVTEKDKKGHVKMWVGFLTLFSVISYGAFIFAVLNLNGWPLSDISTTAKVVKTSKPTTEKIFIPAINLTANSASVKVKGDPSYSDVTVSGSTFGFGITASALRQASPFYNLSQLKDGDEIFLDSDGVRYVYKIVKSVSSDEQKLTIKSDQKTVVAKTVGVVNWDNGKPVLETF